MNEKVQYKYTGLVGELPVDRIYSWWWNDQRNLFVLLPWSDHEVPFHVSIYDAVCECS